MTSTENGDDATTAPPAPLLRIVNPDATPEEIATIVALFSAMGGGEPSAAPRRPQWNHPARLARQTLHHGVGGWRSSGLPR